MGLYSVFLVLFVLLEISLRTGKNWNIPFASAAYKVMANDYELENKTLLGGVFICLSGLLVVSFLKLPSALVGIMVLSYADSAASIVGKAYPNHAILYNKRKHWEGTAAFAVTGFIATAFILSFTINSFPTLVGIALLISSISAVIESLPLKYYYDNLTIPFCAALLAQLLTSL